MNYYERHLGDYAKDTAHLTMLEHGAYTLLLDRYYGTEQGIPADQAHRIARARSKEERAAVDAVLAEFFELRSDGWHQERCDAEIERYQAGEPEREVKKANEGNRLKRHREERARLFKALADAGHHAAWNIPMNELRELVKRCSLPLPETAPATPATATQTPDTRHQTPVIPSDADASAGRPAAPQSPKDVVFALGVPLLTASGVKEPNARSFLAMQVKAHGDAKTAEALQACAEERPVEPISWLQTRLGPIKTGAKAGRHAGFENLDYRNGVTADGHLA